MDKNIMAVGAFFGMTAIILGAFGAHALKEILSPEQLQVFETGVKYQMYHALFLLFISLVPSVSDKSKKTISWLVSIGVLLFSGSIYILSMGVAENVKKVIGPLTPIGGSLMITGWIVLLITILKKKS
ncbi:DUF423 domain-containing protein [Flavobacterium silvaticum]|uniref:DUF423 domain-containing protein n=1 Tax=Flavobacterium silvaticum TaxID=1852020 RepID=A0A972JG13_9FLAO|nr:DUF423 domain-containing protein [Flavobacterium silvaticum]NMH28559.1 DUF423 domain-containing protein [Flavobacterium silvaticum]